MTRETKAAVLSEDLIHRLEHLRKSARETSRMYLANLEHDILEATELIREIETRRMKKERRFELLQRIQEALDDMRIKPEKGRRKDLKRIEAAIRLVGAIAADPK